MEMIAIGIGDYVNGHLVEDIVKVGDEEHYLVTFFMCDVRKPQSTMIAKSKVHSIVKKEDFQRITRHIKEM